MGLCELDSHGLHTDSRSDENPGFHHLHVAHLTSQSHENPRPDGDSKEEDKESDVKAHRTDAHGRNDSPQRTQWRVCHCVDRLGDHQHDAPRLPVSGEELDPVEDDSPDEDNHVQP